MALAAGADAVGMIFAPSPSEIEWGDALDIARNLSGGVTAVAVFTNPSLAEVARVREIFSDPLIQLSGFESSEFARQIGGRMIKALHVGDESAEEIEMTCDRYAPALPLLDTSVAGAFGGTGRSFDWSRVTSLAKWRPLLVAGGLTPENVGACVKQLRPFGVDVRSGVETDGLKDPGKIERFVAAVRAADAA